MATYKEELFKTCNINKGFYELLIDSSMHLDFLTHNHITDPMYEYYKESFKFDCSNIQSKYFFKHLNAYFNMVENLSLDEKEKQIIASMIAFNRKPINDLCSFLNSILGTIKLSNIIAFLKSYEFANFIANQKMKISNSSSFTLNAELNDKNVLLPNFSIINENQNIINSILDLNLFLIKLSNYYEEKNKNTELLKNVKTFETNLSSNINKNKNNLLNDKLNNIKIPESVEKRFRSAEKYFDEMHDKYQAILNSLEYDSQPCRYIRTISYIIAYLARKQNNIGSKHMLNITNVDIGWAVGNENEKSSSFYGDSDIAKAFAAYYAFMNVKENPYTEIINNSYVNEMDYNAMMLHGFIAKNGVFKLLLDGGEFIQEVHKTLKTIREIITILDTPITFGTDLLGWLKGLVASLTNSAATIIDLSLGELAKSLFFIPIIPIEDKKYSLSDIYNYINFIRLICENAETLDLGRIDKEKFIEEAYGYLGIDNKTISKIGFMAYDLDLNKNNMIDISKLFKNEYGTIFTAKEDLKLFYSLLQFAIQKHIYQSGDVQFEQNFNYSNKSLIRNIISTLTSLEIFYIFNIYGVNFYTIKKDLNDLSNEKMLSFNKSLYNITINYDHHNQSFYEDYDKMDKSILYEKMLGHDFAHSKYLSLMGIMDNYYFKAIEYNKKQIDNSIFESNGISEIDDFFMRFIPSIIELGKTLGYDIKTFKQIASLLESFCNLITDVLFKKLYLNIKINLTEIIKRYTDDMFAKLDFLESDSFTIDLDLGNNRFVKALDKIINALEKGKSLDLEFIEKCFKNFGNSENIDSGFGYDTIGDSETDYEIGTTYPINPDDNGIFNKPDDYDDKLDLRVEGEDFNINHDSSDKKHYDDSKNPNYKYDDNINNEKIIYEQGNIIIENPNGDRNIIISSNDGQHLFTEETSKKLPKDEFDKLVHIRDFIENVKDKELVHIQNLIKKEESKLDNELNKRLPNYGIIQEINKHIKDLTEELESVKNKNRTMYSESIILKSFDSGNTDKRVFEDDYSYLNEFFNKESILDEVEDIVIKNNSPLTNYQITELLK